MVTSCTKPCHILYQTLEPGVGRDRFFSRQDNSRQRQNFEIRDKKQSRQSFCWQDKTRISSSKKFQFETSQENYFFKNLKTRQNKTRFLSRKIKKNSRKISFLPNLGSEIRFFCLKLLN